MPTLFRTRAFRFSAQSKFPTHNTRSFNSTIFGPLPRSSSVPWSKKETNVTSIRQASTLHIPTRAQAYRCAITKSTATVGNLSRHSSLREGIAAWNTQRRSYSRQTKPRSPKLTSSIAIIGAGDVGSTIAYSLVLNPIAGDVLLIDPQTDFVRAQAQDLSDATYHGNTATTVRTAKHEEAGQCDIIVVTAGATGKKGESRTDLIDRNLEILKKAIGDCKPFREDAILLLVANPVDVLTYFAQSYSGLPKNQVLGSGTFLDSARLRGILADETGIAATSIEANVLGEHGETQFVAWSDASIGGIPLDQVVSESAIDKDNIEKQTRQKAASIIEAKGSTAYGIGGVAASLCKSILFDQRDIRSVSHWQDDLGVGLSMPAVIGREGIIRSIPTTLDSKEKKKLEDSAKGLRDVIAEAEKKNQQ